MNFDSLNFVPKGPNNYIPVLVQIMAWRQPDEKITREHTIPIFGVFYQNLAFPGYFPIFAILIISPYIHLVGLLLQYVALFQTVQGSSLWSIEYC